MSTNGKGEPEPTGNADFDLLIKLMGMTTSDNDNVALVAIRKANALIERKSFNWEAILKGRVKIVADPFGPAVAPLVQPRTAPSPGGGIGPRPQAKPQPSTPPPQYRCSYCSATFHTVHDRDSHERYNCTSTKAPRNKQDVYTPSFRGSNKFEQSCFACLAKVPVGRGYLSHKDRKTDKWQVHCGTGWGCEAAGKGSKAQQQTAKQAAKPDLDNILDSFS